MCQKISADTSRTNRNVLDRLSVRVDAVLSISTTAWSTRQKREKRSKNVKLIIYVQMKKRLWLMGSGFSFAAWFLAVL